jgi:C4-dicarboxylate-specific signal transduction histidine kinase
MGFLNKNVDELANEIAKLKMFKKSNPVKKGAIQQQVFETEQKLFDVKKRLELAEKSSSYELEQLRAEYEKKKQALGKMQSLEQNIATKTVDASAEVRKEAAKALVQAVKLLSQRKTAASMEKPLNSDVAATGATA